MRKIISLLPELSISLFFILLAVLFAPRAASVLSGLISGLAAITQVSEDIVDEGQIDENFTEEKNDIGNTDDIEKAYTVPEDILGYEREYLDTYSDEKAFGTVTEKFFVTDAATDVFGNIAVRNCTDKKPDFELLTASGFVSGIEDSSEPTVLIFHTHTTEGYLLSDNGVFYESYKTRSLDPNKSVVRAGQAIADVLEEKGVGVIHDTDVYDNTYNGAYARSREGIMGYLEKYPSIKIVLDIHRDAIYSSSVSAIKPTAVINGKKAAQIMIITGVEEGSVTAFPNWEENLRFALSLQKKVQSEFEGLMKPIYFCRRKYNMDVTPCSLLLEIGSDTNTLEEAVYAGYLLGNALASLINEYS